MAYLLVQVCPYCIGPLAHRIECRQQRLLGDIELRCPPSNVYGLVSVYYEIAETHLWPPSTHQKDTATLTISDQAQFE